MNNLNALRNYIEDGTGTTAHLAEEARRRGNDQRAAVLMAAYRELLTWRRELNPRRPAGAAVAAHQQQRAA